MSSRRPGPLVIQLSFILITAFALRVGFIWVHEHKADEKRLVASQGMAYEQGLIARSILLGDGFSSPKGDHTGPTAMYTPVYPYILAAVFKHFGVYSRKSLLAALALNSLLSALAVLLIFRIGNRIGKASLGLTAAWLWALYPSVIAMVDLNWTQSLAAFSVVLILWMTVELLSRNLAWLWFVSGLFSAFGLMVNPTIFAALPFLLLWQALWLRKERRRWIWLPAFAVFGILLGCAPWTLRNYAVFHQLVPFRSSFGFELWLGNNDLVPESWHGASSVDPMRNPAELVRFAQLGEIAYIREKQKQAIEFILAHPLREVRFTALRFATFWLGSWYMRIDPVWSVSHWRFRIILLFSSLLPILALPGLVLLWHRKNEFLLPFMAFVLFFPVVYYIAHAHEGYREPIDPILVLLAAVALEHLYARLVRSQDA